MLKCVLFPSPALGLHFVIFIEGLFLFYLKSAYIVLGETFSHKVYVDPLSSGWILSISCHVYQHYQSDSVFQIHPFSASSHFWRKLIMNLIYSIWLQEHREERQLWEEMKSFADMPPSLGFGVLTTLTSK